MIFRRLFSAGTLVIIFLRSSKTHLYRQKLIYCWSHSGDKKIPLHFTPIFIKEPSPSPFLGKNILQSLPPGNYLYNSVCFFFLGGDNFLPQEKLSCFGGVPWPSVQCYLGGRGGGRGGGVTQMHARNVLSIVLSHCHFKAACYNMWI